VQEENLKERVVDQDQARRGGGPGVLSTGKQIFEEDRGAAGRMHKREEISRFAASLNGGSRLVSARNLFQGIGGRSTFYGKKNRRGNLKKKTRSSNPRHPVIDFRKGRG